MANLIMQEIVFNIKEKEDETNIKLIEEKLILLPIRKLDKDRSDYMLEYLLSVCYEKRNKKALKIIINIFEIMRRPIDRISILTDLLLSKNLNKNQLKYIFSVYPMKKPIDYFIDIVNVDNNEYGLLLAKKADEFFNLSKDDWLILKNITSYKEEDDEYHNQALRQLILTKLNKEFINILEKPNWIKKFKKPSELNIPDNIPSVKDAVDMLIKDLEHQKFINLKFKDNKKPVDIKNNKLLYEFLSMQYSISTISEKIQMLSHIISLPSFSDQSIFREFGPLNTTYSVNNSNNITDNICEKYGGCRMYTCCEYEASYNDNNIDLDSDLVIDWFTGECDVCCIKIPNRYYAIREPLKYGGWRGCFCIKCLKTLDCDKNTFLAIGRIIEQLELINIRER